MRRNTHHSLINKLELILAGAIGGAGLLALTLILSDEVISRKHTLIEQTHAWVHTLAIQIQSPLMFDDQKTALEFLQISGLYPNILASWIVKTGQHTTFASYHAEHAPFLDYQKPMNIENDGVFAQSIIVSAPVVVSGETVGHIYTWVDLMPMWKKLIEFGISLLLILAASGTVATLYARRILRRAIQPVGELTKMVKRVSRNKTFTLRATKRSNDEIGVLTDGFNNMLEQIEQRDQTLTENRAHLIELKDAADAANHAKSRFLANMSHEIRSPLNAMIGMAYLALKTELTNKQRDYVGKILYSGEHLLGIINDILDFSKIEAGKIEIEHVDFTLDSVLAKIDSMVGEKARSKGLAFQTKAQPEVPQHLNGDPSRLTQVLINFASNAVKFTESGSISILVSLVENQGDQSVLRFEVIDTGIGVTEEQKANLFQSFQQADASTNRKYGGTGLGLAISKQLVELMGGEVGIESQLNTGSTFWFTVHVSKGIAAPANQENTLTDVSTVLQGARILVAEDNPFNQQVATELLEMAGASVTLASNGREALHQLHEGDFDCVLMDIQMPEMDGIEATHTIRANPAHANLLIIAMTANATSEDRARCFGAGMNDFITKPIQPHNLYAVLTSQLKRDLSGEIVPAEIQAETEVLNKPATWQQPHINLTYLASMVGRDDPDSLRQLVDMFVTGTHDGLYQLQQALNNEDVASIAATAHKIKSPAKTMGAEKFAALCQSLEDVAKADGDVLSLARSVLPELQSLLSSIEIEINNAIPTA